MCKIAVLESLPGAKLRSDLVQPAPFDRESPKGRRQQCRLPIVRMSPLTNISCNPYAPRPNQCVDDEIASDCERAPEPSENVIENARREDGISETHSR